MPFKPRRIYSLEHYSTLKYVTVLWNQVNVESSIYAFVSKPIFDFEINTMWENIEKEVVNNASKIHLPKRIKQSVVKFINPIGQELLNWIIGHQNFLRQSNCILKVLRCIHWTTLGMIDKLSTAKFLIKNDIINVSERFKLACIYCQEKQITHLWNKLADHERKLLDPQEVDVFNRCHLSIAYWNYCQNGKICSLRKIIFKKTTRSLSLIMLENAVHEGILAAVMYFWLHNPRNESKLELVFNSFRKCHWFEYCDSLYLLDYVAIFYFILKAVDCEEILKLNYGPLLKGLLKWPVQDNFIPMAVDMLPNMSLKTVYQLLFYLLENYVVRNVEYYDYKQIFSEIWKIIPASAQFTILSIQLQEKSFFPLLFDANDYDTIYLILKNISKEIGVGLIFYDITVIQDLIIEEKWELIRLFVILCIPEKQYILLLYDKYKKYIIKFGIQDDSIKKYKKFFALLWDIIDVNFSDENVPYLKYECSSKILGDDNSEKSNELDGK